MQVYINNKPFDVANQNTLLHILKQFGVQPPFAILLNDKFLPLSEHARTELQDQDRVDVISAIQGG